MSQQAASAPMPVVSRRFAQFGVALIVAILVACFAILIAARAEAHPAAAASAPLVVAR